MGGARRVDRPAGGTDAGDGRAPGKSVPHRPRRRDQRRDSRAVIWPTFVATPVPGCTGAGLQVPERLRDVGVEVRVPRRERGADGRVVTDQPGQVAEGVLEDLDGAERGGRRGCVAPREVRPAYRLGHEERAQGVDGLDRRHVREDDPARLRAP